MKKIIYNGPNSVNRLMDVAGTTGINNSDYGLWVVRDGVVLNFKKGDTICVYPNGKITKLKEEIAYESP